MCSQSNTREEHKIVLLLYLLGWSRYAINYDAMGPTNEFLYTILNFFENVIKSIAATLAITEPK